MKVKSETSKTSQKKIRKNSRIKNFARGEVIKEMEK